jgi:hypothetical protein
MNETQNPDSESASTGQSNQGNKIANLVTKYDLDEVVQELEDGWAATGEDHRSLRDLTEYFNRVLLEQRLSEANRQVTQGEIETLYNSITNDDVTEGDRIRAKGRLEQEGVNVESLLDEFVSYQTIRRYLKSHRGITYSQDESDRLQTEIENIQRLQGKTEAVTKNNLQELRESNHVHLGEFNVTTDVRVYCEDCGNRYTPMDLLERGGCECRQID